MSGIPFSPEKLAALARLSAEINAIGAPPPMSDPVVVDEEGMVALPVPDHDRQLSVDNHAMAAVFEQKWIRATLHAGLTLQWAPMIEAGGVLVEFRGGEPDGDQCRDAVAVFLTGAGLTGLARDLQAIADTLRAEAAA